MYVSLPLIKIDADILCLLQLFKGKPTLKKLQLWTDSAKFNDPLTQAQGRKQYEAQWYGLKAAFSEIVSITPLPFSPLSPSPPLFPSYLTDILI
jgi:hypothetical protein